jgi:long-chain acyl-CoA synthetase
MITIPQRVLGDALLSSTRRHPSKTAIIIKSKEYNYFSLKESAEKLAGYLVLSGIKKGDRVAVYMNNSWPGIVAVYGITLAGAVFLVVNPQTKANKLQYILNDSEAKTLISENTLRNELTLALTGSNTIKEVIITGSIAQINRFPGIRVTNFENIFSTFYPAKELPQVIPNDLAALIYTSGTTGFPKGVMMTHQSMVFTSWSLIEYLRLSADDRIILLLPLAFDYGLYQLLMAITLGGSLVVEKSFIFQTSVFEQIETYKPTVFPGVPTIFAMMIETSNKTNLCFDCIKTVTNTAAALPAEFIPYLKRIFPNALIFKMYGLTECKRVCYLEPELIDIKSDSVGKAIPGTEVFLLSPEGNPVPPGERGILHIRGPHVMLGYWHKEDLSQEMLRQGNLTGERILCSNDWFKMDEEGFLYFLGRTDDIIKTRGEKVSPVEIENVIYKIPGIKEVAIIGIPDQILGESIVAFITIQGDQDLDTDDIQRTCTSQLEIFMVPQKIIFVDEMPKSFNGKIDKKQLLKTHFGHE